MMSPSENILRRIRMFVTDADGTLMGRRPEFEQYRAFRSRIEELRSEYGIIWVVCTGRSLRGYKSILNSMRIFGISPDFVIVNHAYIFERKKWGHLPHWIWNLRILWLQWKDEMAVRRALPRIRDAVMAHNPFVRVKSSSPQRLCFRFDDEAAMAYGAEVVRAEVKPHKYLQVFQWAGEVCVRVVPFTKGLAVTELARHLGIRNDQILVVGDGHNDISMMELDPPCYTACPANAASEVVATVHRTHGHIASERSLSGVMEVLTAYEQGQINDKLPADWVEFDRPPSTKSRSHNFFEAAGSFVLGVVVLYTLLLVMASFLRCPGREVILKPYHYALECVQKGIQLVWK